MRFLFLPGARRGAAHPELEIRAGKTRIEAFKSLAQRTKVDDVRALTAMLIQTDRFGERSAGRCGRMPTPRATKRRQRAEKRRRRSALSWCSRSCCFLPGFLRRRPGAGDHHVRMRSSKQRRVLTQARKMNTQLIVIAAVIVVGILYLMRRRSRLNKED